MTGEFRGWQPDPFGIHEFRFFADDGKPTQLVRDGDQRSYDRPPCDVAPVVVSEPESERKLEEVEVRERRPFTDDGNPAPLVQNGLQGSHDRPPPDLAPILVRQSAPEPEIEETTSTSQPRPESTDSDTSVPTVNWPSYNAIPVVPPPSAGDARDSIPTLSRSAKIIYVVVLTAMALSAVALLFIHLVGRKAPAKSATATTSTASTTTTLAPPTTTIALPSALKSTADAAAADLISSWAAGNQTEALSVATTTAVSALFAGHYTSGLVIDRGCSVAFSPIVCTYGPPGGASPTDPIYELSVSQAPGGWYVSSAKINN